MKLINLFNWVNNLVKFCTFNFDDDDGGAPPVQQSTSYSTNLPEYAQPYYSELLKQTGNQVFSTVAPSMVGSINPSTGKPYVAADIGNVTGVKPYQAYTGERVAGFQPEQITLQQQILGLTSPGQFAKAGAGLQSAQTKGMGIADSGIARALGYQPSNITADQVGVSGFTAEDAARYMNPYQQNVTDIALRETRRQGDIEAQKNMLGAMGRGTFGGARQALIQAEQDRNLMQALGDIQAKGSASGYQNAQQQFNADIARELQSEQLNQAANLQADQLSQQGQQYAAGLGKDLGLAGLATTTETAKAQGALGATEQQANLERLKAQAATAEEKQALQQQINDLKYQQYQEAQNYQRNLLDYYSNILRGNAGALGSTQVQYTAAPSTAQQIASLGLSGLSIAKALS
jgi:hypothetical protein